MSFLNRGVNSLIFLLNRGNWKNSVSVFHATIGFHGSMHPRTLWKSRIGSKTTGRKSFHEAQPMSCPVRKSFRCSEELIDFPVLGLFFLLPCLFLGKKKEICSCDAFIYPQNWIKYILCIFIFEFLFGYPFLAAWQQLYWEIDGVLG